MNNTLLSYNQEVIPKFLELADNKALLKEFMDADSHIQEILQEIKDLQQNIKDHCEDKKPSLVREIKDITTDIGLAVKAAAKGTDYKPQELKTFFAARAAEKVEVVVSKGELFVSLTKEIS